MSEARSAGSPRDSSFQTLAKLFMPARPDARAVIIEAPADWHFDPAQLELDVDSAIWGRGPDGSSRASSIPRKVLSREISLRRLRRELPPGLRITGVHRLPPRLRLSGRLRRFVRSTLRSGLLVELNALPAGERVLDEVFAAALASGRVASSGHVGSEGSLIYTVHLEDRRLALLRIAVAGSPGDPSKLAVMLDWLARASVSLAPRHIRSGRAAGAGWLVEDLLPGKTPARLTQPMIRQVAEACARFPQAERPEALRDDLLGMAGHLPDRAASLERLAELVPVGLRTLPAVLRHGDLWAGNLLVEGDRVRGLVDWDAAHRLGVPGADLMQLLGTDRRIRKRETLGSFVARRAWRSEAFDASLHAYWSAIDIRPTPEILDAAGLAWWASEVHWTLLRVPQRVSDQRWLVRNVDPVIDAFGG